ncbi:MAG: hypothetical protein IJQ93_04880 [Bacteroidales bacterium]|nr:hypothetical protein [Bacteroidales bacterium]
MPPTSNNRRSLKSSLEEEVVIPLYSAIISLSPSLPPLSIAERLIDGIKKKNTVTNFASALAGLRAIVDNPDFLIDPIEKLNLSMDISEEEINKYLEHVFSMPKELLESFPPTFSGQALRFVRKANSDEFSPTMTIYRNYLDCLFVRLAPKANKLGLHLEKDFSVGERLFTTYGPNTILAVYDFLVKEGCLYNDTETRNAFLALFINMGRIPTGYSIKWIKETSTATGTNMHLLYITFEELGVDLENRYVRRIVENKFIGLAGAPITLKKRESHRSEEFRSRLRQVIQNSL